ncbi:2270_t:CDS:2 [Gigaspora margarita]|uniref:2270_t:CDS:1 n=1 Tax=Gigaspora margarita TaxID=4874 RepID=A0ABN7UV13_GIGMA|nr:2270_t:CDS:2 [Gigaspora margarita]
MDVFTTLQRNLPKDDQHIKIVVFRKNVRSTFRVVDDLDSDKTLADTREYLAKFDSEFFGWQNTVFRNDSIKIPHSYEDSYRVEDILVPEEDYYSLYIEKDETIPCVPELVRKLNLGKGYKKQDDNSIIAADMSAFSIKDLHIKDIVIKNKFETIHKTSNKSFDQFWLENFENDYIKKNGKVAENLNDEEGIVLNKYTIKNCQKAMILFTCNDLKAKQKYIDAIEDALDKNYSDIEKIQKLNEVGNDYGFFGWHEINLGGKFLEMTGQSDDEKCKILIGGDIATYDNIIEWIGSLENYKTWAVTEYKDKFSLYELLPEDLQQEIRRLNGIKVLYSKVEELAIRRNYNFSKPIIIPIPIPSNILALKDYKIFASVLNKRNKSYKNVFGIRIDYQNAESPYFTIHRIGRIPRGQPQIDLAIPWIIIGYEKDLPTYPILNISGLEDVWTKDCKDTILELQNQNLETHCLIDMNLINICCNQYNLYDDNIEEDQLKFEINCVIFNKNNAGGLSPVIIHGPTSHVWTDRKRRTLNRTKRNLFTGNKWVLPNENFIFASLMYLDRLKGGDHFILNINPKYPIIKSSVDIDGKGPKCMVSHIVFQKED